MRDLCESTSEPSEPSGPSVPSWPSLPSWPSTFLTRGVEEGVQREGTDGEAWTVSSTRSFTFGTSALAFPSRHRRHNFGGQLHHCGISP